MLTGCRATYRASWAEADRLQSYKAFLGSTSAIFVLTGSRAAAYAFLYPNIMLNRYGPWLDMNIVEPTGPESCQVQFEYFHEASPGLDAAYVQVRV